jgi:flagellar biosynthetic protein FliQ
MDDPLALAVREALWITVQIAGPPLVAMLVVGVLVSLFQALTQIQEATLAFVPKLIVMGLVLLLLGPMMTGMLRGYAQTLFERVVAAGGAP